MKNLLIKYSKSLIKINSPQGLVCSFYLFNFIYLDQKNYIFLSQIRFVIPDSLGSQDAACQPKPLRQQNPRSTSWDNALLDRHGLAVQKIIYSRAETKKTPDLHGQNFAKVE
jgi:hypothetical protein